MKVNKDMRQRLNLLATSKNFVFKELSDDGSATLHTPDVVANDGVYWLSGRTILPNDLSIESVFRVNTSSGGDLLEIYWKINGEWYEHDSIQTFRALGITREKAFPFDWQFNIELENDIFHPK